MTTSVPSVGDNAENRKLLSDIEGYLRSLPNDHKLQELMRLSRILYEESKIRFNKGLCTFEQLENIRSSLERLEAACPCPVE